MVRYVSSDDNSAKPRLARYIYSIMCLFPFPNKSSMKAKLKGIEEFECGACPECLQKKSRLWALRTCMEAKVSVGCMVTLTYDTYKVGYSSKFEENPTDPTIPLSKRHCQLFIKRLRKHFEPLKLKYLITAEKGRRTGRSHYHALLFGVQFDDLVRYKKSDRGNWIYKSRTLEKIWNYGICTVDCINLSAKTARYCTKYCAKDSGADDTFMLFSRGIGEEMLLKEFNGKSYWIDGREYAIPKQIWQKVIEKRYRLDGYSKYTPRRHLVDTERMIFNAVVRFDKRIAKKTDVFECALLEKQKQRRITTLLYKAFDDVKSYTRGKARNEYFQFVRDNDLQYRKYVKYWQTKAELYELSRPTVAARILLLPENKYWSYKQKSIKAKQRQVRGFDFVPPRSKSNAFVKFHKREEYEEKAFAPLSRHYWANDTISPENLKLIKVLRREKLIAKPQPLDTILERDIIKAFC